MYPYPNPYGLTTGPAQLFGRSRATGLWITAWVAYGRPVILDTSRLGSQFDSRLKEYRTPDAQTLDRYAGRDRMPDDALLVLIHPQMYRDLLLRTDIMDRSAPDVAAEMIDDVCRLEPGLATRMRWTYFGRVIE